MSLNPDIYPVFPSAFDQKAQGHIQQFHPQDLSGNT
jgi:hypothetical protein